MTEMLRKMKYRYLFLGVTLTLALSLIICTRLPMDRIVATTIAGTLSMYLFPVAWIVYHFRKDRVSMGEWLRPVRLKIGEIIAAAFFPELLGMGMLLLITVAITYFWPAGGLNEMPETTTGWGLTFLSAVVLAPLCEELIFRGFVLNKMLLRFSPAKAVILSSVIFGSLHLTMGISPAIVGAVLCIITMKYQSIIPGMVIHSLHNLAVVMIKYTGASSGESAVVITPAELLPLLIMAVVFVVIGLVWLVFFIRNNWHYTSAFGKQPPGDGDGVPGLVEE